MGDIHNMDQEVGLAHLVEGRFEGIDQVGRQLADKADSIGEEEGKVLDNHLANSRVERGEEFVLGKDLALGQKVHDGRFADIGIAHEGHADQSAAVLALGGLLLLDLHEALL